MTASEQSAGSSRAATKVDQRQRLVIAATPHARAAVALHAASMLLCMYFANCLCSRLVRCLNCVIQLSEEHSVLFASDNMAGRTENTKKVIVIGDGLVGKTCFVSKVTEERFINNYHATIGGRAVFTRN